MDKDEFKKGQFTPNLTIGQGMWALGIIDQDKYLPWHLDIRLTFLLILCVKTVSEKFSKPRVHNHTVRDII